MINALGFIEVYGMVAGIEAADAMLKSANVRLLREQGVRPGQISLVVEGDLAACRAAVNAGAAAASRVGTVIATNVIGRPDADTETMILDMLRDPPPRTDQPAASPPPAKAPARQTATESEPPAQPAPSAPPVPPPPPPPAPKTKQENAPAASAVKSAEKAKPAKSAAKTGSPSPARGKLGEVLDYISASKQGYSWKELKTHFPGLPQHVRKQLDAAVASGQLARTGARYRKPGGKG